MCHAVLNSLKNSKVGASLDASSSNFNQEHCMQGNSVVLRLPCFK